MAFIKSGSNVISFADFQSVVDRDQRLFDTNEGLDDETVFPLLMRATERILSELRSSSWWKSYYVKRDSSGITAATDIPPLNANKIIARVNDFSDLCVYTAMADYILPMVADFGTEDNAERQKMGWYAQKAEKLMGELITAGDWYDFDGSGVIGSTEKQAGYYNPRRIR